MAVGEVQVPFPADPTHFAEAVAAFRKRVPMPKDEWEALEDAQHEYAFTVAGVAQADMVAQVWDAIDSALSNGEDFEAFKERVTDMLETSWGGEIPGRLETIFDTNVNTAYNAGRKSVFTSPTVAEARPYWRFEWVDDDDECEICEACNGVILPADDPWWDDHIGPLHFRCRCSFTALSAEEAGEEGISDKAPGEESDPDDGFGDPGGEPAPDWQPTMRDYPKQIRDVLTDEIDY